MNYIEILETSPVQSSSKCTIRKMSSRLYKLSNKTYRCKCTVDTKTLYALSKEENKSILMFLGCHYAYYQYPIYMTLFCSKAFEDKLTADMLKLNIERKR